MDIGERIREVRNIKGLTQKKLGELCGINEANIRKYESGRQNPKIETIQKIADALNVPFMVLCRDANFQTGFVLYKDEMDKVMDFETLEYLWGKLGDAFRSLNKTGQHVAVERVEELTKIPDYQRKEAADSADND